MAYNIIQAKYHTKQKLRRGQKMYILGSVLRHLFPSCILVHILGHEPCILAVS